jgi:hypothetical protein
VSPLLGVGAYLAADHAVSEKPAVAVSGRSYRLAAKPNCRYASGMCVLANGDVEVLIRATRPSPGEVELSLSSKLPISQALVSSGREESFSPPIALVGQGTLTARLELSEPRHSALRWAITIQGAAYFAETPAVFVDREELYSERDTAERPAE